MLKLRVIKTGSLASAEQAVQYLNNKRIIVKHVGSAHTESELNELLIVAQEWVKDYSSQLSIFPEENPNNLLLLNHGFEHLFGQCVE